MEMKIADLVDRATILMIKQENLLPVDEELKEYEDYMAGVPKGVVEELYSVNKRIWDKEMEISTAALAKDAGHLVVELRDLNFERVQLKNRISLDYGQRPEFKKY